MEKFKRQSTIVDYDDLQFPIHIIGCGGIGSWSALLCAKIGCRDITIYDNDTVEEHNTASQFFKTNQIGLKKIIALQQNVKEQTDINLITMPNSEEEHINNGVVIIAVDSMEERIKLYEMLKDKNVFIIDARMGGLQLEIYSCDIKEYSKTLIYDPENVDHEPCTERAIAFNCAIIGGMVANNIRLFANNKLEIKEYRLELNYLESIKHIGESLPLESQTIE